MHIDQLHVYIMYLVYIGYMPNLMGIFVSGTCLATTYEEEIAVFCVLTH